MARRPIWSTGAGGERPERAVHHLAGPAVRRGRELLRRHPSGHAETPCPFNSVNDDPNDVRLKHNADAFVKGAVTTITSSRAWTRHSAIFVVAEEGDFTGNAVSGGWDSPAGCCDSPVLPKGAAPR